MENSKKGVVLSTILCYDDDKDGLNGQMNVYTRWWSDENQENKRKFNIPFEIITEKMNSSEVRIYKHLDQ
jgi:hypothetical protein